MAGHSKWSNIKHRKAAQDAKKNALFTKHANNIAIAAKNDPDTSMNPGLKMAIDNAKADNMPNAKIDKAIARGSGADKDANVLEEIVYEGYGPGGTGLLVRCVTDNRNRTVSNIRMTFDKNGGKFADSGAVSWQFERKGVAILSIGEFSNLDDSALEEKAFEIATELNCDDFSLFKTEDGNLQIELICSTEELSNVRKDAKNLMKAEIAFIPIDANRVEIGEKETEKLEKLIDKLDELEDVAEVVTNKK